MRVHTLPFFVKLLPDSSFRDALALHLTIPVRERGGGGGGGEGGGEDKEGNYSFP